MSFSVQKLKLCPYLFQCKSRRMKSDPPEAYDNRSCIVVSSPEMTDVYTHVINVHEETTLDHVKGCAVCCNLSFSCCRRVSASNICLRSFYRRLLPRHFCLGAFGFEGWFCPRAFGLGDFLPNPFCLILASRVCNSEETKKESDHGREYRYRLPENNGGPTKGSTFAISFRRRDCLLIMIL